MANSKTFMAMFIMILVGSIIGLTFYIEITDTTHRQTQTIQIVEEEIDIATARTDDNDIDQSVVFRVSRFPGSTGTKNLTIVLNNVTNASGKDAANATGFQISFDGVRGNFSIKNSSYWHFSLDNTSTLTYTIFHSDYVEDNESRSIILLIGLFVAIGILVFVIVKFMGTEKVMEMFRRI